MKETTKNKKPAFTRRHYTAIAQAIAEIQASGYATGGTEIKLAELFAEDNPQFNRERFIQACKGE